MSKMILTEYGLVKEGQQPQPQTPAQQNKLKAVNDLARRFNIQPSKLMQMIQSGKIPGISSDTMQKLKTFFVGDQPQAAQQVTSPPVIPTGQQPAATQPVTPQATTPAAAQQQTQPALSPSPPQSQQTDNDPFQSSPTNRIKTTEPSLRMMPQQKLQMAPQSGNQPLRMMPQTPLPGEQQPQQPATSQQQPQKLRMARQKRLPQQRIQKAPAPSYEIEETLSENQLKQLIKEVAKILEKLQ